MFNRFQPSTIARRRCDQCDALIEFVTCGAIDSMLECAGCGRLIRESAFRTRERSAPARSPGLGEKRKIRLENIFPPAMVAIQSNAVRLFWLSVFGGLIWTAVMLGAAWATPRLWQAAQDGHWLWATGLSMLILLTCLFTTSVIAAVFSRTCLDLLRHPACSTGALTTWATRSLSWEVMCRLSLFLALFIAIVAVSLVFGLVAMIAATILLDPEIATLVGTLLASLIVLTIVFGAQWLLWPALFIIVDDRGDVVTALGWSVRLSCRYARLSLVLMIVYATLATVGSLVFYVGQILVLPVALMPMAVGYIRFTSGEIIGDRAESVIGCESSS